MRITLRNDFHNTEAKFMPRNGNKISRRSVQEIKDKLCNERCIMCDPVIGTRGPQEVIITIQKDGSATWSKSK